MLGGFVGTVGAQPPLWGFIRLPNGEAGKSCEEWLLPGCGGLNDGL